MASRLEWFDVTIPANTPVAAPVTVNTSFQQGEVTRIQLVVPPGPAGTVGIQIWSGGGQFWPNTAGNFMVLDNTEPYWDVENAPNNGNWAIHGYNTDIYPHLIQVGFSVVENGAGAASLPTQTPVGV